MSATQNERKRMDDIFEFLSGAAMIDGHWFSDTEKPGKMFGWRKYVREAQEIVARLDAPAAAPVAVRKPVGVAMVQSTDAVDGDTLVVCDDGSAWWMNTHTDETGALQYWRQYFAPVPGTSAAVGETK